MLALHRRHWARWLTGWALALSAGTTVFARGEPNGFDATPPGNNTGNPVFLVLAPTVQKELALSDDQKSRVNDLARAASLKGRDLFQAMVLSGGNNPGALMTARDNFRRENDQAIAKVLDVKQRERLDQIALRAEGPLAVGRPEIAARLNLNNAQNQAVQNIMMLYQQNMRQLAMSIRQGAALGQFDPSQMGKVREQSAKLRSLAVQDVGKVLDRKQRANFDKMLGAPFDVAALDPSRGGAVPAEAKSDVKPTADEPATTTESAEKPSERPGRKKTRSRP